MKGWADMEGQHVLRGPCRCPAGGWQVALAHTTACGQFVSRAALPYIHSAAAPHSPTFSLQCLHTVVSPAPSMARQPRHVSRFCANFMMPPLAAEGVVTVMDRVCAPAGADRGGGWSGGLVGGWGRQVRYRSRLAGPTFAQCKLEKALAHPGPAGQLNHTLPHL